MKIWLVTRALCVVAIASTLARAESVGGLVPLPIDDMRADGLEWEHTAHAMPEHAAAAIRACGTSCPQWPDYFVFDVLFLQRNNSASNRLLAVGSDASANPGAILLDTADLRSAVAPGVRLLYGRRADDEHGWEVGYLGVYGMWAEATTSGVNQIAVPGAISDAVPGWLEADSVQATYASSLNIAEANIFRSRCCEMCSSNGCGSACRCTDLLCGVFWAGLEETSSLNVRCCPGDPYGPYRVTTSSNLIGAQLGLRRRRDWHRWALEGTAKAGLAGNVLSQSSGAITSTLAPGETFRNPTSATRGSVGLLSMLNATAIYRLTDHWGLRAGYNLIWLDGLALAPDQWDFTNTTASGRSLAGGGCLFLHGANLGIERRW